MIKIWVSKIKKKILGIFRKKIIVYVCLNPSLNREPGVWGYDLILVFQSLTVFPFTHSVANELEAMAEPQPNVLNLASTIFPFSST